MSRMHAWQAQREASQGKQVSVVGICCLIFAMLGPLSSAVGQSAQGFSPADQPPGAVGRLQAYRIPNGLGYYQPIEVRLRDGVQVAVLDQNEFSEPTDHLVAGMLIGSTYRLKLTNVPGYPGSELYPSIEVVHRLYPPNGMAEQFPVVVELNTDDFQAALEGSYVVKVVYLEDPQASTIQKHDGKAQPYFDVAANANVLNSAQMMGRPMVIVRMGSRVPIQHSREMMLDGAPAIMLATNKNMGKPARVFNMNQRYADQDPSYVPQLIRPTSGEGDLWNMEHIFDGGDRAVKARVGLGQNWEVSGVEPEDTVGHFDTLNGERLVAPSNRVAIYSPRFSAVRQRTNVVASATEIPTLTAGRTQMARVEGSKVVGSTTAQFEQARLARDTASAGAVKQQTTAVWSNGKVGVVNTTGRITAFENLAVIKYASMDGSQKAMLAKGRVAAATWGGTEGVNAIANFQSVDVVYNVDSADEVVETHSPLDRPKLRIVKVASKDAAQPGERIQFTLRFDNVGDQRIGNVTLMDNLSDRLEFVPGSAICDVKCEFYTKSNERGSTLLRWDIEKPLNVTDGGVIEFECVVR